MQFTNKNRSKNSNHIKPGLYIVSTPIGNLADITFRAIDVLNKSDFILCEDTRRSSKLMFHYKIKKKLIAYHKFNEKNLCRKIINFLKCDKIISLLSDAGTPTISDPGLFLIKTCIKENINIIPIPGASAVTTSMSISGFGEKFIFYGFLPKKKNETEKILKSLSNYEIPIVFFVPSNKVNFYLQIFKIYFFEREILIAKEMTKMHEYFFRDSLEKIKQFNEPLKGEITIVISGKKTNKESSEKLSESVKVETMNMLKKYSQKDVVEFMSKKENIKKKVVYNFCLKLKK